MGDYFFGKNNIEQLCIQLENKLPIKKTAESRRSCRRFLEEQMRVVCDKYGNKRPDKMPIPVFINKLNEKSMGECIKAYEERSGKKINLQKNILFINFQWEEHIFLHYFCKYAQKKYKKRIF